MSFAYSITPRSINVLVDGRMRTIDNTHPAFAKIGDLLKERASWSGKVMEKAAQAAYEFNFLTKLREMLDIKSFIAKITQGKVRIGENAVFYGDVEVKQVIATRLMELLRAGHDVRPLARFLDRLMLNPLPDTIEHLYLFLEKNGIPITPDGCFLAFKKVDENYCSYHQHPDGTHERHMVGDKPSMPREDVNPNCLETCARGYHFCSYDYLPQYQGQKGHVMVMKIAPEDVVAIPYDYDNAKGRTWTYEVVDEVPEDEASKFFDGRPLVKDYSSETWTDGSINAAVDDELSEYPEDDTGLEAEEDEDNEIEGSDEAEAAENGVEAELEAEEYGDLQADADAMLADVSIPEAAPDQRRDVPVKRKPGKFQFAHYTWNAKTLAKEVARIGQRGFNRLYGVPRSTLQGWLKQIS